MSSWTKPRPPLQKQQTRWLKGSEANPGLSLLVKDKQDPHLMDFKNYLIVSSTGNYAGIRAKNNLSKYFISLKS